MKKTIISGEKVSLILSKPEYAEDIMQQEINNYPFVSFDTVEEHLRLMKDPDCLHMIIEEIDSYERIGHVLLCGVENPHKTLEFKRLVIYAKGSGYGREVLRSLKAIAFEKLAMHRMWLDVFEDNSRAIRLYESEGFTQEGLLRDSFRTAEGFYRSQFIYSMLQNEYYGKIKRA